MRVEARLLADCDLEVLDCGCDMVMCSGGSDKGGQDEDRVYSQSGAARGKHRPRDRGDVKQAVDTQ